MGIEENKAVVGRYMASMGAGAPDFSLLAEDFRWWVQGIGWFDRAGYERLVESTWRIKTPSQMTIHHVTAEEDRVAVESTGRATFIDGTPYENEYNFLFMLRDGRIAEVKEYYDTAYAAKVMQSVKLPEE